MTTVAKIAALWIGQHRYAVSATMPGDAACAVHEDAYAAPPTWSSPAKLIEWTLRIAQGLSLDTWQRLGLDVQPLAPRDHDKIVRYAVLIGAAAGAQLGAEHPIAGEPHPWRADLESADWRVRTRNPEPGKLPGPWLTLEGRGAEIGVCMTGWCDPGNLEELAVHGLSAPHGSIDPWESCYVHGQYRHLTGWPLSAGAGMAAVKALWRWHRTGSSISWAPRPEYWAQMPVMTLGRPAARPWHLHWATPEPPDPATLDADTPVRLWDANADHLVAWGAARFARGRLVHTGADPLTDDRGRHRAGWHLISVHWTREGHAVAATLPPVWGSRTPDEQGRVWVTHIILGLLDALRLPGLPPQARAVTYQIHDSYTCAESGQLAKPWAEKLKSALSSAREEQRRTPDSSTLALSRALKHSYSRGYPLLETSGIIRRPDHVDTIIDQRYLSAYLRMWEAALQGRYPLQVSADEILYAGIPEDDDNTGPLGPVDELAYGHYKSKRTGTYAQWHAALHDGRSGRWWLTPSEPAVRPAYEPSERTPSDSPAGEDWFDELDR